MKKTILILISFISLNSFADQDPRDMIQNEIDSFYGKKTTNVLDKSDPTRPQSAIHKVGTCLKYNKEGEKYWTKYETMTVRIEDIGKRKLKIRKLFFMSDKKWLEGSSESMSFQNQDQFSETKCPSEDLKLTPEEIEDLKKKNVIKNV